MAQLSNPQRTGICHRRIRPRQPIRFDYRRLLPRRKVTLCCRKRTQWALTREEMKNCVWVKPELVVQIEFGEWTPDGHLRHSKFSSLRDDKDPSEVLREK